MSPARTALLALPLMLASHLAQAQINGITPYSQAFQQPAVGEYEIARVIGPGSFVSATVNALGIDTAQVVAYVRVDGKVILSGTLSVAGANLDQHVNNGVGVTYTPTLNGSARISFGLPQSVNFRRELRVYVRVEDGAPWRIFGQALLADPA